MLPGAADWQRFRLQLKSIGAFGWSGSYKPSDCEGGTDQLGWSIDLRYPDGAEIVAQGYGALPTNASGQEADASFDAFRLAVSRLAGGRSIAGYPRPLRRSAPVARRSAPPGVRHGAA